VEYILLGVKIVTWPSLVMLLISIKCQLKYQLNFFRVACGMRVTKSEAKTNLFLILILRE